jgi:hypothetical protein
MTALPKKKPSGRCNSPRANVRTSRKYSDKGKASRASTTVKGYPCVPEALVHPLSARMVASQRAIAKACGVADSTVGRLVATGEIRRVGQLLDLADALEAVGNRPRPGRPARSQLSETNKGGRTL